MSEPPRVADQLQTIIDLLRQSTAETHNRLNQIEARINHRTPKPYKYQPLINYLKTLGREESSNQEIVELNQQCLTPTEAISILQTVIEDQKKTKCLTKEELLSFFRPSRPMQILEPPFRK